MKHLYLVFAFLFISFSYGQSTKSTDIEGFKMYPNPVTNGKVFIAAKVNAPKKIYIYDVLGTEVLHTTILGNELNVSDLDAGVYAIRVFQKDKFTTRKLIIK